MITESEIYDYIQSKLPDFQFVEYANFSAPPENETFGIMKIMNIDELGWGSVVSNEHSQLKTITLQIDFYGENAFNYTTFARQTIIHSLSNDSKGIIDLKGFSKIRNLSFLEENMKFKKRYSFDLNGFICDTVSINTDTIMYLEHVLIKRF